MDRLSQLPDDIQLHILSFLSIEEAHTTSLLSKHWRLHWLYVHDFDFNTSNFIKPLILDPLRRGLDQPASRRRFFKWLNKVLQCVRDHVDDIYVLNKLRIQFPLYLKEEYYHEQIDEWISYAFARRVQSLELDLTDPKCFTVYGPRLLGSGAKTDMSCLTSLSLSGINVCRRDVDSFLFKCPFLEHLKVCQSNRLESVEICGSTLALKHLEITHCGRLEYIIVRDTCLVSLTLTSARNLVVENNQKLVYVCVSDYGKGSTLQMLSSCLSRLQVLTLHLGYDHDEVFDQANKLIELKQLTLVAPTLRENATVRLTTMLSLSPKLEKLTLNLVIPKFEGNPEYRNGSKVFLPNLKVIEVCGYCGEKAEDEFLIYVLEHIVAPIEKIIFDPHTLRWDSLSWKKGWKRDSIERRAEMFRRVIPSWVKFIVL